MRSVNLLDWIEEQFLPELDSAISAPSGGRQEIIRALYDNVTMFEVYAGIIMINVLEHDRQFTMYAEYSELLSLFDNESEFNSFMGRIKSPGTIGGDMFAEIRSTIDPDLPYVISHGKIFYITKQ